MNNPLQLPNPLPDELADRMFKDRKVRRAITRESHFLFFHFYFAHYVTYPTAPFHFELFRLTEDDAARNLVVVAFRDSGKSTLITTSYPLWAILGRQQMKFVLILCQSRLQAKAHMMNLKRELEGNVLLKNDLGPFQEESDEWGSTSLVFSRLNARITAASTEQSIRGLRHRQHRPDVIIGDDLEDLASTRTHESRQKTFDWLTGEVMPAGSRKARLILVGNYLHDDALLMRMKRKIELGELKGVFRAYPLQLDDGTISWPGKYPDQQSIDELRKEKGDDAFLREYQLKIINPEGQIIFKEWIGNYEEIPPVLRGETTYLTTGIDLALVKKDSADFTAMVSARIIVRDNKPTIYILPHPINKRLEFPEQRQTAMNLVDTSGDSYHYLFIESYGMQGALVQELTDLGYKAEGATLPGSKDERLRFASTHVQNGTVRFPKKGCEDLLRQLLYFGVEKHDDLADAFAILVTKVMDTDRKRRGGFCVPSLRISKQSFYDRGGSEDWADREDRIMLGKINPRHGTWHRIMG